MESRLYRLRRKFSDSLIVRYEADDRIRATDFETFSSNNIMELEGPGRPFKDIKLLYQKNYRYNP